MSDEQVAPETKGVTVKYLATVDLGLEIEDMAGRQHGFRGIFMDFSSFEFFLLPNRIHNRPNSGKAHRWAAKIEANYLHQVSW